MASDLEIFLESDLYFKLLKDLKVKSELMNISLTDKIAKKLISFIFYVNKWNKTHNLTSITDFNEMLTKHILDSISVNSHVAKENYLDIGTGAGFPGVPLAILNPDKKFYLLDGASKRINFIKYATAILDIKNVEAIHARMENYKSSVKFDGIFSRAVSSFENLIELSSHLVTQDRTKYYFLKANIDIKELESLKLNFFVEDILIPGLNAKRSLVII
ncbi:MAG: 16S rRNA (guanine(527)-N(7))-methyltransferase RsmG [Psittacicella sp.]